jgi:RND family efflux transporter MFP subunit
MKTQITSLSLIALLAITFAACQPAEQNQDLATLETKRDSLKTALAGITEELTAVEEELARARGTFDVVNVTALEARSSTFNHYFTVQGNIETDRNAQVFPETQGIVQSIRVNEGQQVAQGQTLMTLDTELIRKNIAEVETQYELAKDIFERQERLWEQNIGSEVQYLEAKSNKERLENTLATLNKQVSMGVVKAPFSGVIDQVSLKVGEMASPAMPVARIVSLDEMYVTADVSENYVAAVEEGMRVEVIVPDVDTLASTIRRVGRFIKPENRTFEVTIGLDDHDHLRPNMYCALRINDLSIDSAMVVPASMVQQDTENNEFLYVLRNEGENYIVQKRLVTTGQSYRGNILVLSGIKPGDLIVDKGARRVVDGQEVELFSAPKKLALQ